MTKNIFPTVKNKVRRWSQPGCPYENRMVPLTGNYFFLNLISQHLKTNHSVIILSPKDFKSANPAALNAEYCCYFNLI